MSSAARFLLEFEATGDQEVVAKIKAVGAAGKQTAAELQSLQGIEDPFEPIATGADSAIAPIEGVGTAAESAVTPVEGLGTAAEGTVTPLTDMGGATEELGGIFDGAGTEAETFSGALGSMNDSAQAVEGGITPAADAMGDFGESASTSADQSADFGSSVAGVSGSIVAIGGAIGGAVSAFFRYQDAQLRVQKSQNALARAQEAYRKTEENIQAILATATSNIDGIAAANARYVAAQARVNELLAEGVTSGEEYDAAVKELQDSQAALSGELAKGGGDAVKLTGEMNKLELQSGKVSTASGQVEKNLRGQNQALLESVTQYATVAGSLVQIVSGFTKLGPVLKTATGGFKDLISWVGRGGFSFASLGGAIGPLAGAALIAYDAFILFGQGVRTAQGFIDTAAGNTEKAAGRFKEAWDFSKMAFTVGPSIQSITDALKLLGIDADAIVGNGDAVAQSWANVGKTFSNIGATISSGASSLVNFFTETVPQAIDTAWQSFQKFVQDLDIPPPNIIADFFTQTVPEAIGGAIEWLGKLHADMEKDPPKPLQTFFTQTLPQAIRGAWDTFTGFIGELQKDPPHPIVDFFLNTIPQGIQGAIDWVGKLHADMEKNPPKPLTTFFTETLPQGIQTAWDQFGKFTADLQKNPPKPLTTFFTQTLPTAIQTTWDKFGQFTNDLQKNPPKPLTTFFTQTLPTAIHTAWDTFTGFIGDVAKTPPDAIPRFFIDQVVPAIQTAVAETVKFFSTLGQKGPTPRQLPKAQRQPQAGEDGGKATANTRMLTQATNENTAATNANAGAQATLTSRFSELNRPLTQTTGATANLQSRFDELGSSIQQNAQMTEAQSAAVEKLVGPTVTLNKEVAGMADTYSKVTAADAEYVAQKEAENRANIIGAAGYNNANVAAIQYQQALTAMTQSLVSDTDQKNANAKATLTLVNSEENAQNAIATINEEYANSVDKLADLETVLGNTEARTKAVATVSNEFAASLKEQSIELQGTLQALQDVENQEQGVANAILQTKVSLEESNQALREAKAVHDDMGASMAKLQTALNDEKTALIEEEAGLQASIAAGNDSVIMRQRLDNAYLKGVDSIGQWNTELAASVEEEQGAIDALAELGFTFQDLPGYMEPTVENLKLVAEAQLGVGDAAEKMTDMAIENYNELTSASQGFADSIKDAFLEGDIEDAVQKAFDKIPPAVRASMSTAQQEEYKGIQEMRATAEAAAIELGVDLDTEGFAVARADFTANLEDLASSSDGIWSQMWARAAEITKNGSQATVAAVKKVIEEGGGPELMLQKLNQIVTEAPGVGNKIGTGLVGGVKSSFTGNAVVDQNTLSTMMGSGIASQVGEQVGKLGGTGFGTGFTGNAVLDANTMVNNMGLNELPPKAGTIGKESGITLEQEFAKQLESIVNTINTMQLKPIPFTADVSAVHQALATLTTNPPPMEIVVTADVSPAHQAIAALVTMKPEPIVVTANTAQAVSSLNAASNAALTMRNNFNAASSGVKSAVAAAGSAVTSFSSKASSSFAKAGTAGTQMANKVKSASSSMKSSLSSAASSAASFASKCVSSFNKVGSSATSNASKVRNLASAISRLKSKTITITTRYVTSGRPRGGLQHGGAFIADSPTTIGGMKMGEHYKPELVTVTPLTNPNSLDKTITVNTPRGGGGGSREVVIPVTLMLDNKVLIRTVRRGLVEEVSGAM
jgi:hypothetical protein